jgi:TolA-binding protein
MSAEVIIAICSLCGTLVGSIGGVMVSGKLTNWRIEQLEKKMDKHNGLIERMALVEREDKAQWKRLDDHEERLKELESEA